MTPERAVLALERRIKALFAESREAVGEECTAYIMRDEGYYVYVVFANGRVKPEGEPVWVCETLDEAVNATVDAVARQFPDHDNQTVVWRRPVAHETWEAHPGYPDMGMPANDAGWCLNCRLVGIPR